MKVKVIGAAGGEVTGSAYLVDTQKARLLVDAGMFQGGKRAEQQNRLPIETRPDRLQAVLVTHAHFDHTGRLPLLTRQGYRGPVYASAAAIELADLILKDAAKIQFQDTCTGSARSSGSC